MERQKRFSEASATVAQAQRTFLSETPIGAPEDARRYEEQIENIALASTVQAKDVYLTAAHGMQNRRGLSPSDVMEGTEIVAKLFPADSGRRDSFLDTMLSVRHATGKSVADSADWLYSKSRQTGMGTPDIGKLLHALPDQDPDEVLAIAQAMRASTEADPARAVLKLAAGLQKGIAGHSIEDVKREKEAIAEEKKKVMEDARHSAKETPEYQEQFLALEEQKASLTHVRRGRFITPNPQEIAKHKLRLKEIDDAEQRALEQAESRVEKSPEVQNRLNALEDRERELASRQIIEGKLGDQMAYMRQHPEGIEGLIKDAGLRKPEQQAAIRQFLSGQGPDYQALVEAKSHPQIPHAVAAATRFIEGTELQITDTLKRGWEQKKESRQTDPLIQPEARLADVREGVSNYLVDVGETAWNRMWHSMAQKVMSGFSIPTQLAWERRVVAAKIEDFRHPEKLTLSEGRHERPTALDISRAEAGEKVVKQIDEAEQRTLEQAKPASRQIIEGKRGDEMAYVRPEGRHERPKHPEGIEGLTAAIRQFPMGQGPDYAHHQAPHAVTESRHTDPLIQPEARLADVREGVSNYLVDVGETAWNRMGHSVAQKVMSGFSIPTQLAWERRVVAAKIEDFRHPETLTLSEGRHERPCEARGQQRLAVPGATCVPYGVVRAVCPQRHHLPCETWVDHTGKKAGQERREHVQPLPATTPPHPNTGGTKCTYRRNGMSG